jgi:non-homologous end joining protein Ku
MRAINKVDLSVGESDIPVAIYSAVEQETSFKQLSVCCSSPVNYLKVCSQCKAELTQDKIKKALEIGDTFKEVNVEALKLESGNLKFLGLIEDNEENGVMKDGTIWYLSPEFDKKNKDKSNRALMKFCYLRDSFRLANKCFLAVINLRGREHRILVKPYFNAFICLGLYNFERIRNVTELGEIEFKVDENVVKQMAEKVKEKPLLAIKDYKDTRQKLLEEQLTKTDGNTAVIEKKIEENPMELLAF